MESICQSDLGPSLERIARTLIATRRVETEVSVDPALPEGAEIYLGVRKLQAGLDYTLDASRSALSLKTPVPSGARLGVVCAD